MARRGRSSDDLGGRTTPAPLNAPFRHLHKRWNARPAPPPVAPVRRAAPAAPAAPDEGELFTSAMDGVVPIPRGPHARIAGPAPATGRPGPVSEEAETLAALSDLVAGVAHFDITDTREYVEGVVVGLDPRVVRRLRRGGLPWRWHPRPPGPTRT